MSSIDSRESGTSLSSSFFLFLILSNFLEVKSKHTKITPLQKDPKQQKLKTIKVLFRDDDGPSKCATSTGFSVCVRACVVTRLGLQPDTGCNQTRDDEGSA